VIKKKPRSWLYRAGSKWLGSGLGKATSGAETIKATSVNPFHPPLRRGDGGAGAGDLHAHEDAGDGYTTIRVTKGGCKGELESVCPDQE
jgi:hypothetical protein